MSEKRKGLFAKSEKKINPKRTPGPGESACPFCGAVDKANHTRIHVIRHHPIKG